MKDDFHRLDHCHDLTLPEWGPYSKKFFGISHIADRAKGMRFDFTVVPALYRRQLGIPDALRPSGYLPWEVAADLENYSYRQQLEPTDRIYADIRFAKLHDNMRLAECRCMNRTGEPVAFGVHFLSNLVAPPEKRVEPVLPGGCVWLDALDHAGLEWAKPRPQDNLVYDALRRGEVRCSGTVRGGCIGQGWGADAGDRLRFRLPVPMRGAVTAAIRCRVDEGKFVELLVNGVTVGIPGTGEWHLVEVDLASVGEEGILLVSQGGAECRIDGIALGAGAESTRFREAAESISPHVEPGLVRNSRILTFEAVDTVYGVYWNFDSEFVRRYRVPSMMDVLLYCDEVHQPYLGDCRDCGGEEEWVDAVMQPLTAPPGGETSVCAVVCSGTREEVAARLVEAEKMRNDFARIAENSTRSYWRPDSTEAGKAFVFSRERLAAVTLTNVVFPTWFKGQNVRHHTPGRRWNSLYTWDSGFIGLGLLELGEKLAVENLNAYLTEPDDEECAFIHHGSPVPVQFYLFAEIMNRGGSRELAACFYPKLRHYYRFMAGRAPSSTMRGRGRGTLVRSWDYFYNSGGWDDYPPQWFVATTGVRDAAPAVGSSHVIRCAKILRKTAKELGIDADLPMYEEDIAQLTGLLHRDSWDEESGSFSYVRYDEEERPCGILRHESGCNYDLGMDGAAPLLAGICTPEQKAKLWERLESPEHCRTPFGLSTVDRAAPYFRMDGYWNGSIWMPYQWFFWKAALDDGRADFAWWIAHTALAVYEREVASSRGCYEQFTIAAGRGGGWHHFSALSCPILCWFGAYFTPGRLTGGLDTAIRDLSTGERAWCCRVAVGGEPGEGVSSLVAVTGPGKWRALYGGAELPVRQRVAGTVEFDLPWGSAGELLLERV